MQKKMYIVFGNGWMDAYGVDVRFFGIYSSEDKAIEAKIRAEEEYFDTAVKRGLIYDDERDEIEFYVEEIEVDNDDTDISLGSYIE